MTNVTRYPLIDDFDTTLAQAWDGATGTVYLNDVPGFTFPSGTTSCIVVNPGKSNMQVAEINALDSSAGTVTVSSISINKGASVAYTQQSHAVGSVVRISNNYQFWSDLVTAINSKVDGDTQPFPSYADATARDVAITVPLEGMVIKNTATGTLQAYLGGTWLDLDTGTVTPNASTTVAGKVELATAAERAAGTATGGTGATLVPTNDALVKTSSGASDENKIPVLNSDGYVVAFVPSASTTVEGLVEMATDAEATAGTDETRYINPKQAKDNYAQETYAGVLDFDTDEVSGTTVVAHGLGKAPTALIFNFTKTTNDLSGLSSYSAGNQTVGRKIQDGSPDVLTNETGYLFQNRESSGDTWTLTVSMDDTNITFTRTVVNTVSSSGPYQATYIAIA